jgi:hypothetical protein
MPDFIPPEVLQEQTKFVPPEVLQEVEEPKKKVSSDVSSQPASEQSKSELEQPTISEPPEYSINGQKYDDRDTFLKEAEKYQGKEQKAEINVKNDKEAADRIQQMFPDKKTSEITPTRFGFKSEDLNKPINEGKPIVSGGDIWEGLKAGTKQTIGALGVAAVEQMKAISTLQGGSWTDALPKSKTKPPLEEKDPVKAIENWSKEIDKPIDSFGYKMGGMLPFLGMALATAITKSPTVAGATAGVFGEMGFGEGLMKADEHAEETKKPVNDVQRLGTGLLYTAAYSLPMAEWMGKLLPTKLVGNAITGLIKQNPEIVDKTASSVWDAFVKNNPEKAQQLWNISKQMGLGIVHSTASLAAMETGKQIANSLILGEDFKNPISKDILGTGIIFGLITKPFAIHGQNVSTRDRRIAQGVVQLSVNDKGTPFEVVKDKNGNISGLTPNGQVIKIKSDEAQDVLNNSVTIPTPLFEQSIKQGMEKVNEEIIKTSVNLLDLNKVVNAKTPDEDILNWTNSMHQLGKISDETQQSIVKNIDAKRNAEKDLKIADWDAPPEVRSRLAQLNLDKARYSASDNFPDKVKAIKEEINYILNNKKLPNVEPLKPKEDASEQQSSTVYQKGASAGEGQTVSNTDMSSEYRTKLPDGEKAEKEVAEAQTKAEVVTEPTEKVEAKESLPKKETSILNQDTDLKGKGIPSKIKVNGVDRSTTNSKGKKIHSTVDGVRNFWKWFGNSKVKDKKGQPIVVYHGTTQVFDKFSKEKLGSKNVFADSAHEGFFFAENPQTSENYTTDITNIQMGNFLGNKDITDIVDRVKPKYDKERNKIQKGLDEIHKQQEAEMRKGADEYFEKLGTLSEEQKRKLTYLFYDTPEGKKILESFDGQTEELDKQMYDLNKREANEVELEYNALKGKGANIMPVYLSIKKLYDYDYKGAETRTDKFSEIIKKAKKEGYDGVVLRNVQDGAENFDNIYVAFEPEQIKSIADLEVPKDILDLSKSVKPENVQKLSEEELNKVAELENKPDLEKKILSEGKRRIKECE